MVGRSGGPKLNPKPYTLYPKPLSQEEEERRGALEAELDEMRELVALLHRRLSLSLSLSLSLYRSI